jgi:argininosuccinate lyase
VNEHAAGAALDPSMLAVDIADALVRAGVTFREAHEVVGALVREAENAGATILDLDADRAETLHPALPAALEVVAGGGLMEAYRRSVDSRSVSGGSARQAVLEQIAEARATLERV